MTSQYIEIQIINPYKLKFRGDLVRNEELLLFAKWIAFKPIVTLTNQVK